MRRGIVVRVGRSAFHECARVCGQDRKAIQSLPLRCASGSLQPSAERSQLLTECGQKLGTRMRADRAMSIR